jgi:hypothetical protein
MDIRNLTGTWFGAGHFALGPWAPLCLQSDLFAGFFVDRERNWGSLTTRSYGTKDV